jgi:hypothetical protein
VSIFPLQVNSRGIFKIDGENSKACKANKKGGSDNEENLASQAGLEHVDHLLAENAKLQPGDSTLTKMNYTIDLLTNKTLFF